MLTQKAKMDISTLNIELLNKLAIYLSDFVSPNRRSLIDEVILHRTKNVTVVLEDIFQPHNASAVIRSCEAFGVQEIHIIEQRNKYRINPDITIGSNKWINIFRYNRPDQNNTQYCLENLKENGFKIVATTLHADSISLEELPINEKVALCFGTEEAGLTDLAHHMADYRVKIPMGGFTQSLNLSVSAAISVYDVIRRMKSNEMEWQLSNKDKLNIRIEWYLKNIKNPDKYLGHFARNNNISD